MMSTDASVDADAGVDPQAFYDGLQELEAQLESELEQVALVLETGAGLVDDLDGLHFDGEAYQSGSQALRELRGLRQRIEQEHDVDATEVNL